jgi:hypothetical protein
MFRCPPSYFVLKIFAIILPSESETSFTSSKGAIIDSCNFSGYCATGNSGYEETYQTGDPII